MFDYFLYLLSYVNMLLHASGYHAFHLIYVFGLIPLLDFLIPKNLNLLKGKPSNWYFESLLYMFLPCLIWLTYQIKPTSVWSYLSLGIIYGQAINIAHELIHKGGMERWVGKLILNFSCYGQWDVQHIKGHHRNVGLPSDPATAPVGMSIYQFVPRSVIGGVAQAWELDKSNFVYSWLITSVMLYISWLNGKLGYHVSAAALGILFLEFINYIEHYGLVRQPGERVAESHSWDAPEMFSSFALFKLPLHADHHMRALKPYRELEAKANSKKLPFGYPAMILISLYPSLFFKLVDRPTQSSQGKNK